MRRLLTYAQMRDGRTPLNLRQIDLNELGCSVAAHFSAEAAAKRLKLSVDIPPDASVSSDSDLIVLVLQNLLGNSMKYSERGTIRVSGRPIGNRFALSVSDE